LAVYKEKMMDKREQLHVLLSDEKILLAWENFPEAHFDHEPTYDDILLLRLKSVAKAQLDADYRV